MNFRLLVSGATLGAVLLLSACSSKDKLTSDQWMHATSTQNSACAISFVGDGSYSHNCNGISRYAGTWTMSGDVLMINDRSGRGGPCNAKFQGEYLLLDGGNCLFAGRYENLASWLKRN